VLSLQRLAGNRAVGAILRTPVEFVLKQMQTGDAWGQFKASLDPLLVSLKREPDRAEEVTAAIYKLIDRIYNENVVNGNLRHAEIRDFLVPMGRRIGSLLPATADGHKIMQKIVTVLTMTGDAADQKTFNSWADEVFAAAVGRAELEQRRTALSSKSAALEKRKGRVPRGLTEEHAMIDKELARLDEESWGPGQ
jgi:hypothetical protein